MERAVIVVCCAVVVLLASILMSASYTAAQCIGSSNPFFVASECRSIDQSGYVNSYYAFQGDYTAAKAANKDQFESDKASCDSDYQDCKSSAGKDIVLFRACAQTHNDCISTARDSFAGANESAEIEFDYLTERVTYDASTNCQQYTCCNSNITQQCGFATLFKGCVCTCCPSI